MSDYLCEELLVEIFKRLPLKSLVRCTSVSNSWRSLIYRSDFIRLYMQESAKRNQQKILIRHLSFEEDYEGEEFYTSHSEDRLPLRKGGYRGVNGVQFPYPGCHIVGSCNGILCLLRYNSYKITLWNPSIRRNIDLPYLDRSYLRDFAIGFGFDPTTDGYAIVLIPKIQSIPILQYEHQLFVQSPVVHTTKTDYWFEATSPVPPYSKVKSMACFFNGALHWVVRSFDNVLHHYILTFDINTRVFGTISLPEPVWEEREKDSVLLTTIKESLAVCYSNSHSCSIWMIPEYKNASSWDLILRLENMSLKSGVKIDRVLQLSSNGDFLLITENGGIGVNPATGKLYKLEGFGERSCKVGLETYIESLALLNEGMTCEGNQRFVP